MGTLYENISFLCSQKGIKPGKMCTETGISRGLITDLKMERKTSITVDTAKKIADYFGVSVDRVLGSEQKEKSSTPEGVEPNYSDMRLLEAIRNANEKDLKVIRTILGIE